MSARIPADLAPGLVHARAVAGTYSRDEVIDWIDERILGEDTPDERLFDLSLGASEGIHDFLTMLEAWAGPVAPRVRTTALIASLHEGYRRQQIGLAHAISSLCVLMHDEDSGLTADEIQAIYHLDDGHDLASRNTAGTLDEVGAEFLAFAEPFAAADQAAG